MTNWFFTPALLIILMSGCLVAAEESELEFSPEIEKLLNETSDEDAYTNSLRCLPVRSVRATRILDDQHVVFEMPRKTYYLVRFEHRCFGLRRDSALIYETRSMQLCRMDPIRAGNATGIGTDIGPPCRIPGFTEVTREQVALLSDTLKNQRGRRSRAPPKSESAPEEDEADESG